MSAGGKNCLKFILTPRGEPNKKINVFVAIFSNKKTLSKLIMLNLKCDIYILNL